MKIQNRPVELIILAVYFALFAMSIFAADCGRWLLVYSIFICLHLMRRHRYNQTLLIILIFISTYFIYMTLYYFLDIQYSTYSDLRTLENTNGTLRVFSLFVVLLFYFIKQKKPGDKTLYEMLPHNHNSLVFWGCTAVMLMITVYALMGKGLLSGAQYGKETTNSSLFEYYFIFAIIAQCNLGEKTEQRDRIVLIAVNVLYAGSLLLLGLRLVTMMVLITVFALNFENRFPTWLCVFAAIMGFFGMSAMSMLRAGLKNVNFLMLMGVSNGYMYTNQGDVFQASTVHFGMVHNGFMTWPDRLRSLGAFCANIFLPSSAQLKIGILNKYIEGTYRVGGGGFGAMYAYAWLGYAGVILLALYIAHFINKSEKGGIGAFYGAFLTVTSMRWLAYSLPVVFKMGFYLAVFYILAKTVKKTVNRRVAQLPAD